MAFVINKDSVLPAYRRTLLDENQEPVNLAGVSEILLELKRVGSDTLLFSNPATIVSASEGLVQYEWQAEDTEEAGEYEAVWYADGMPYPNGGFELVTVFADDQTDEDDLLLCTVAQARSITRKDIDVDELAFAQTTVAIRCGLDLSDTDYYEDLDDQDQLGLRQAVAFQALWLRGQFDFLERSNVREESTDGETRKYPGSALTMAPWAERALQNTRFAYGYSTIDTPPEYGDATELPLELREYDWWTRW